MSAFAINRSYSQPFIDPISSQNPPSSKSGESTPVDIHSKISKAVQGPIETLKEQLTPTNVLLGVCLATHAVTILYPDIKNDGAFYLPLILKGEVWRLATAAVLHLNAVHLFLNMYALSKEGPKIEKNWGARGFVQIAALATTAKVIATSVLSPNMRGIGLSGVLYGMQGALAGRALKANRKDLGNILSAIGRLAVAEWINAQVVKATLGMNVGVIAHVSGFAGGMVFGWLSTLSPISSRELAAKEIENSKILRRYPGDLSKQEKSGIDVSFSDDNTLKISFNQHPALDVTIRKQDLFTSGAAVIVNAANSHLGGGGGIDGAIHAKGGAEYAEGHRELQREYHGKYVSGHAAMIGSGFLKEKHNIENVIVVAGPQGDTSPDKEAELYSCYFNTLVLADEQNKTSVAFPSISTGIFGFPKNRAAAISLKAIHDFVDKYPNTQLKKISIHYLPNDPSADLERYSAEIWDPIRNR